MVLVVSFLESNSTICAGMSTRLVQVHEDFRVTKRTSTSITSSYPGVREPNGLVLNHCHGTQRLRLELHSSLLETGTTVGSWTGSLVVRPWLSIVRSLREICDRGFDGVSRYG